MSLNNTSTSPYGERNFVIEAKDKVLFTLMKVIADAGFPALDDPRCLALRMELYKRKRVYSYKELRDGTIYIHFPRVNPFVFVYQFIKYYMWGKYHRDDDSEDDEGMTAE